MDLLTLPFRLPFLPITALIGLGRLIQEETERQAHDPAAVRRRLEEAEQAHAAGEMSDEDLAEAEREAAARVIRPAKTSG